MILRNGFKLLWRQYVLTSEATLLAVLGFCGIQHCHRFSDSIGDPLCLLLHMTKFTISSAELEVSSSLPDLSTIVCCFCGTGQGNPLQE